MFYFYLYRTAYWIYNLIHIEHKKSENNLIDIGRYIIDINCIKYNINTSDDVSILSLNTM